MDPKQAELIEKHAIRLSAIELVLIEEPNDIDASRQGRNTVYLHCETYGGRPSYASCLCVIDQTIENDGQHALRPDCAVRINDRTCPSIELRRAEIKAKRALFYIPYEKMAAARKAQAERDREDSPIKFRRKGKDTGRKFTPTDMTEFNARQEKPVSAPRKPEVIKPVDDDYNTNILEKVAKKMMDKELNNEGE
jgi:hypothetical protein